MNSTATSSRWQWPALAAITVLYAFAAAWTVNHLPVLEIQNPSQSLAVQAITGGIEVLLTSFAPVTILTPTILLWALLRAPSRWMICSLGISLIACVMGAWVGYSGHAELNLFSSIVVVVILNAPVLIVLGAIIVPVTDWLRSGRSSRHARMSGGLRRSESTRLKKAIRVPALFAAGRDRRDRECVRDSPPDHDAV